MKKSKIFLLAFGLTICLAGCGSSKKATGPDTLSFADQNYAMMDDGGIYGEAPMDNESYSSAKVSGEEGPSAAESARAGRKLIRTVNLDVETMEFDNMLSYVQNRTAELGGYVESMNAYNGSRYNNYSYNTTGYVNDRTASLKLRIPKENLDVFLSEVAENGNIINRSEQEIDVTLDYVDLDSHKAVLLAEQERLLTFMEQAETMEDIIVLESRLSEIRYQIESMESRLRTFDNQIEYSTVYIGITEVVELTPVQTKEQTTWERISEGFMHSLKSIGNGIKEFFVGLVIISPYLVMLAVIVLFIVGITLFSIKKSTKKRLEKMKNMPPMGYAGQGQHAQYPGQLPQPGQPQHFRQPQPGQSQQQGQPQQGQVQQPGQQQSQPGQPQKQGQPQPGQPQQNEHNQQTVQDIQPENGKE